MGSTPRALHIVAGSATIGSDEHGACVVIPDWELLARQRAVQLLEHGSKSGEGCLAKKAFLDCIILHPELLAEDLSSHFVKLCIHLV